jgi:Membrane-bound lysozyme-inhibitor of c-type lysozyme
MIALSPFASRTLTLAVLCVAISACSSPKATAPAPSKTVILDAGAPVRAATPVVAAPTAPASAPAPVASPAPLLVKAAAPTPVSRPVSASSASSYRMPEGIYRCDEGKRVTIKQTSTDGHSVTLNANGADTPMKFMPGTSGALRYENATTHLAWILTSDKGMLFDNKKGQRLANNCKL